MIKKIMVLFLGSSTLPRATTRATETDVTRGDKVTAATSSTSLYDNVAASVAGGTGSQSSGQGSLFTLKLQATFS